LGRDWIDLVNATNAVLKLMICYNKSTKLYFCYWKSAKTVWLFDIIHKQRIFNK